MSAIVAIRQIEAAALTDKQYRAARRLLDQAVESGHLKLTKESALNICTTSSEGSMRRLLGQLKQAEIISYRVNGYVYINFKAWVPDDDGDDERAESDHPRAESARGRAKSDRPRANSDHEGPDDGDDERAKSDHQRAESDHQRAGNARICFPTYTGAHAQKVGRLVGTIPYGDQSPTYQPDPNETALSLRLLLHIRLMKSNADRLSQTHPFERIREAVAHWWENRGELFGEQPGIIVRWLDNWEESGVPALSDEFRRSELYRQFRTPAEIAEEEQLEAEAAAFVQTYVPPEATEPAVTAAEPATEPATPHQALWGEILSGIATATPAIYNDWLRDSALTALDAEQAVITVGAKKKTWIESRLGKQLRRELAMRGHRPEVIVYQEVGDDSG